MQSQDVFDETNFLLISDGSTVCSSNKSYISNIQIFHIFYVNFMFQESVNPYKMCIFLFY